MNKLSLLAVPFLLSFGALAQAQSYDYGAERVYVSHSSRPTQLVKYYKPTQTYYGKGFVVRYGYSTTNPAAAGYVSSTSDYNASVDQYLSVANPENRRDITIYKKTVKLPAKDDQQDKRDVQPAPAKQPKAQP